MESPEDADAGTLPIRPTLRGLVLLGLFAVLLMAAVVVDIPSLVPIVVGIGVPLVAGPVICHSRRTRIGGRLSVHLHAEPAMVAVSQSAEVVVTVAVAEGPLPPILCDAARWVRLRADPVHGRALTTLSIGAPETASGWLPPARSALVEMVPRTPRAASARLAVPTDRRGVLTLRPLRWWIHDPFSLYACAGAPTRCPVLVVYPAPMAVALPEPSSTDVVPGGRSTGRSSRRPLGDVGELAGLRPYRPGDRLRSIHWPSRSGPGPLLVRDFAPEDEPVVRIVLDDRTGVHRRRAYDAALSLAHGLLAEAASAGWSAELSTLSGRRATVDPSPEGAAQLLPLLALLNPIPRLEGVELLALDAPFTVVTTTTAQTTLPERLVRLGRVVAV